MSLLVWGIIWQDVVFAMGSVVGILSKLYALIDEDTVWNRWASIPNAFLYIPTIIAFATLELYLTAFMSSLSMLIWFGIGIWRAPNKQD